MIIIVRKSLIKLSQVLYFDNLALQPRQQMLQIFIKLTTKRIILCEIQSQFNPCLISLYAIQIQMPSHLALIKIADNSEFNSNNNFFFKSLN